MDIWSLVNKCNSQVIPVVLAAFETRKRSDIPGQGRGGVGAGSGRGREGGRIEITRGRGVVRRNVEQEKGLPACFD